MRFVLLALTIALSACSGLPPEPAVPLTAGDVAIGITADLPIAARTRGTRGAGFSVWAGVGAGSGVDIAFSADAPFALIGEVIAGRGNGGPFIPPGMAVRKSFDNGVAVGVGLGSDRFPFDDGRRFYRITAGPFVSLGTASTDALAARATVHLVYEAQAANLDSTQTTRRGLAIYGVGTGGTTIRGDSSLTVPGVRGITGAWLAAPHDIGVAAGPFVQRVDTRGPSESERR